MSRSYPSEIQEWLQSMVVRLNWETGAIPVFHRWQEWLQLIHILIFFRFG